MADSKITALDNLTAADPVNDMFPIVDVSDTTMAASGTTKRISVNNLLSSSPTASGALTVTGLVTAGSATITGDLTVNTNVLKVDSTNDRVGIGTATPAYLLDIADASAATRFVATNTNNSAYGAGIYLKTMNGASMVSNATLATANDGTFNLFTGTSADSTKLSINTSGDVNIALGNVVMATSGKGIDFSATASGSGTMTSELFNDYEEGTFTATLTGATTNPTIAVTSTGRYTKVGRIVTVQIGFENVITTGASGLIGITGLPFANNSNVNAVCPVGFYSMATFTGSPFGDIAMNGSSISFYANNSNAIFSDATHNAGTTRFLRTTATYQVA